MPSLNTYVVYCATGEHSRQNRSGIGGGFTLLKVPAGTTNLMPNAPWALDSNSVPPTITVAVGLPPDQFTVTYGLVFVNVTGLEGGAQTSFDLETFVPGGTVGIGPIVVLEVYTQISGGGVHPVDPVSGATIDAFDESAGMLVGDFFVTVMPDPTGSETSNGNVYGYVDTTKSAESISAYPFITPTGAVFDKWVYINQQSLPPAGEVLNVTEGSNVLALAWYTTPTQIPCSALIPQLEQAASIGIPIPVGVAEIFESQIERCFPVGSSDHVLATNLLKEAEGRNPVPKPIEPPKA
jgi:hypothetical protein